MVASLAAKQSERGRGDVTWHELLLGSADRVADAVGILHRPFPLERMLAQARKHSGLDDFGDERFAVPLRRLLDSCLAEADLSLVGRIVVHWDVARFLRNLLHLREAERAAPEILRQRIVAPTFVTGLPRSGTSFLHMLLMQDPENMVPTVWQTLYPYPDRTARRGRRDPRVARVARYLRLFERLAPEFRSLYPIAPDTPQECSDITAHVFASLRFDTNYRIPSYRAWLDATGHLPAYRFHRRFLQHLQYQRATGGTWVLKCPDHVFALDAIRDVYPDARMVFVHRDPVKVLESVTRLTEVLRRPFSRHIDRCEIGAQESLRWLGGAQRMIDAADRDAFATPICHIRYRDLIADPLSTIEAMYRHFGLALSSTAAERIRLSVAEQPNGGYGEHHYRIEDYGLEPLHESERFAEYMARFDIAPEGPGRCSNRQSSPRPRRPAVAVAVPATR